VRKGPVYHLCYPVGIHPICVTKSSKSSFSYNWLQSVLSCSFTYCLVCYHVLPLIFRIFLCHLWCAAWSFFVLDTLMDHVSAPCVVLIEPKLHITWSLCVDWDRRPYCSKIQPRGKFSGGGEINLTGEELKPWSSNNSAQNFKPKWILRLGIRAGIRSFGDYALYKSRFHIRSTCSLWFYYLFSSPSRGCHKPVGTSVVVAVIGSHVNNNHICPADCRPRL